ncbi:MAG: hypothetical protein ABFD89_23800 [Bryobacteraceae bacterium]
MEGIDDPMEGQGEIEDLPATTEDVTTTSDDEGAFDEEATAAALEGLRTANPVLYEKLLAQMEAEEEAPEDDEKPEGGEEGQEKDKPAEKPAEKAEEGAPVEDEEMMIATSNLSFQRTRANIETQAAQAAEEYKSAYERVQACQSRTAKMIERLEKSGLDREDAEADELVREMKADEKRAYDQAVQVYQRSQGVRSTLNRLDAIRSELAGMPRSIQRHGYDYAYLRAVDPKKELNAITDEMSAQERAKRLNAYLAANGKLGKPKGEKAADNERIKAALNKMRGKVRGQKPGGTRGNETRNATARAAKLDSEAKSALNKPWS